MIGASGFSFLSPVNMPTFRVPKILENSLYFEFVKAFKGDAYQHLPLLSTIREIACSAIQVLPAPVGAVTRQSALLIAESASSWNLSGLNFVLSGTPIKAKTFFNLVSASGLIFGDFDLLLN